MYAGHVLAGAMGCASWRSRHRLLEHAALAPPRGTLYGGKRICSGLTDALGLNEVGVTDLVLAAIWRFGPEELAYGVSSRAESDQLGADIAILHQAELRILLYQAKLATYDGGVFKLKSRVTDSQIKLLAKRAVRIDGAKYSVTGRLALYQTGMTPFIRSCPPYRMPIAWWGSRWGEWEPTPETKAREPQIGRRYYQDFLFTHRCSPSGIVATPIPSTSEEAKRIAASSAWPWEFETYEWCQGIDTLSEREKNIDRQLFSETVPDFEEYIQTDQVNPEAPTPQRASDMAVQLHQQFRLPANHRLYLIIIA
jgi:hypothetical protein